MTNTISIFPGSIRPGRQGENVVNWIAKKLKQRGYNVHLIDPNKHPELQTLLTPNQYNPKPSREMSMIHQWLQESDGFILVTPEYNRSFSGTIKNALDQFLPEYEKKPFGIVSYSIRWTGGIRANDALRLIIPELKGIAIPTSLIIPLVHEVFDDAGMPKDPKHDERLKAFLDDFEWNIQTLKEGREKISNHSK